MRRADLLVFSLISAAANAQAPAQATVWAAKPDVAGVEKAVGDRMAAAQSALDRLTAAPGARTIENTLAPYDEAVRQYNAASYFANLIQQTHPEAAFRDKGTALYRKVSAAQTALSLNRDVYKALSALDVKGADDATRYYVQRQLLEFRLAGVDKDDAARARLKKLNDELTEEQSMFDRNISDLQNKVETNAKELDGLPQDFIDRHKPGADGKIVLTTNYPDVFPVLKFAKSDALRRRLYSAFWNRAYPKNKEVLRQLMKTRDQIASMLGYKSWADYNAADKMIRKGGNIGGFIEQLDNAARPVAQREYAMLLAELRKSQPGAKAITDYQNSYLTEQVRRSQFDFDSQTVRPFLPFKAVRQGILDTAAALFHVQFQREENAPAWDASVETWLVMDGGKPVGRFYLDMHPRPGKFSHAEMAPVLDGVRGVQLPEAALVCNFPAPTADDPGLMEYGDVVTFFHEFGHLMHWILGGQQQWAGISGISMEGDFVEAPSQMLEEWMRSPQVLATFARNYKTGEAIPAELVARMNRASAFGRAIWVMQQGEYTALSYDLYKSKPSGIDIDAVTARDQKHYTPFVPLPGTHIYASFGHLAGYSSAYYTYMYDKEIAEDFFSQFDKKDLINGPAAMRYRKQVLEPGGSMSANDLVKNFLGREQNMAAMQRWMAEEFEPLPAPPVR